MNLCRNRRRDLEATLGTGGGARAATFASMIAGALAVTLALAGCAPAPAATIAPAAVQRIPIYPDVTVTENIAYGPDPLQQLDVCSPADATISTLNNGPTRAIIMVHGGSWREGDKAGTYWRSACEWMASEGFITFSVNYRLAPANPYPAAINDVRAAVEWVRKPAQITAYGYDPALIAAFGGSAGGNLVTLLGASGTGPWGVGSRVAAVVDLSGPIELGPGSYNDLFVRYQLDYLGCSSYEGCAVAAASPLALIDPTDPPMFVAHSTDEIIPPAQGRALVDALALAGVEHTFEEVPGAMHSIGMLDDGMRANIVEFLRARLG